MIPIYLPERSVKTPNDPFSVLLVLLDNYPPNHLIESAYGALYLTAESYNIKLRKAVKPIDAARWKDREVGSVMRSNIGIAGPVIDHGPLTFL